jgi:hypothetical protein
MFTQVSFSDFQDAFRNHDRQEQFSYDGKKALFDYLEEYEQSTDQPVELDVIALCCEYTEYDNLADFKAEYETYADKIQTIEDIENYTTIITIPNSEAFIIIQF